MSTTCGCFAPERQTDREDSPLVAIALLGLATFGAAPDDYLSAKQKFDSIESGRLRAGSRVELSVRELDAYAEREVPEGVRNRASSWWLRYGDGPRHGGFR